MMYQIIMKSESLQKTELWKERIELLEELAREITPQYESSTVGKLIGLPIKELKDEYLLLEQVPGLVRALIDTLEPTYVRENKEELNSRLLRVFNGKNIVEIGCGPGLFHPFFRHYGAKITGVEINPRFTVGLGIYSPEYFRIIAESSNNKKDIVFSCRVFNETNELNREALIYNPLSWLKVGGILMHYALSGQLNKQWENVEEMSKGKLHLLEFYNENEIGGIGEYAIWRKIRE